MTVHRSSPHDSAPLHVTGAARYVDDIPLPRGSLHLAFGLSTIARGQIVTIDLSEVRAAQGVVKVLVAADLPYTNDVSAGAHDEPLLSDGKIHYHGQPIFLVIAESHLAARKAARLGKITYTEETPMLSIDDALRADSRFEEGPRVWSKGDSETAIKSAPRQISGRITMGGQEHFYLESQAALAFPQDNGDMEVHSSTQHPTEIQHKVAEALGIPFHGVRVETRRMGGGFGGKESQGNALAVACAVAAKLTRRACKMRYDRGDDMVITGKRHDFEIDYQVGFDNTGRILGIEFVQMTRGGWALDLTLPVADRAMLHSDNAYLLDHVKITSHRLKTNTTSATAFRGFGGPQGVLGIERVMDHIAHELSADPIEVRRVNYYASMNASKKGKSTANTTPYGMLVEDFILDEMTDAFLASTEYQKRRKEIDAWNAEQPIIKKGLGFSPVKFGISFTLTHLNQAGALVHVYADGSIRINHGGTEMGQGLFQKVAQVAAHTFGVGMESIKITATDTAKVPNTSATAASSGSDLNGMAVKIACDTIKERLIDVASAEFDCKAEHIRFENSLVYGPKASMSFADLASRAYQSRVSLSATGFYKTPDLSWDRIEGKGRPFFYFAQGLALSEVVIDTLTGENRILRTDILHDAGSSLNPALDIGQIEGGFVQGAGWLTTEELVWDDKGRLRTHAPSTYKIPACSDRPEIFNVSLWDAPNPMATIFLSKAVGEPPFMHGISAFLALSNAVAACGRNYPALQAPATPECILAAIKRARL